MTNEYKGYPLFNDVNDDLLRAWNRVQVGKNIMEDLGEEESKEYLDTFSDLDLKQIELLILMATIHGEEAIQKQINEIVELENDNRPDTTDVETGEASTDVAS